MYKSVSLYDIIYSNPNLLQEMKNSSKEEFDKKIKSILFELGLDVNSKDFEEKVVLHRPVLRENRDPYKGVVYTSKERSDKIWVNSGYCSLEQKLHLSGDKSLMKEINQLGRKLTWDDQTGGKLR